MSENKEQLFRKKTLDRISSPEQLTDYLHVTNPGIWITLAAVIILLGGLFVWSVFASLESKTSVMILVVDKQATVVAEDPDALEVGMVVTTDTEDFTIAVIETDSYGRNEGIAATGLPDGTYYGTVVTEIIHPISFLVNPNG